MNSSEDDSLKFQLEIDSSFNEQIVEALNHRSLNEMAEGDLPLEGNQAALLSAIIGEPLPSDLKLVIGVGP